MKSRDFCYWLQGYFEIVEHSIMCKCIPLVERPEILNKMQIEIVKKHLNLVFAHETPNACKTQQFCHWLQGFFEIGKIETVTYEHVESIRKSLNDVFVHEIDPSFGNKEIQDKLNDIHGTTTSWPYDDGSEILIRC